MATKHGGEQFSCDECSYKGTRKPSKHSLKLHTQSKHDGIGYACGECGHQATRKKISNPI